MEIIGYGDYVDRLHEEFKDVDKKSIEQILKYGCGKMLHYKRKNIDLYFSNDKDPKYYMYIGEIAGDAYKRNAIYFKKKRRKLRHLAVLHKVPYTGYYYFGLSDEQNEKFKETKLVDQIIYYKLKDESRVNPTAKHFYRVEMEDQHKWSLFRENYEELNAEHIQ